MYLPGQPPPLAAAGTRLSQTTRPDGRRDLGVAGAGVGRAWPRPAPSTCLAASGPSLNTTHGPAGEPGNRPRASEQRPRGAGQARTPRRRRLSARIVSGRRTGQREVSRQRTAADVRTPARVQGRGRVFSSVRPVTRIPVTRPPDLWANGRDSCAWLPEPRCSTPQAAGWTPPASRLPRAGPAGATGRMAWGPGRLAHDGFGETGHYALLRRDVIAVLTIIVDTAVAI